MKQQGLFGDFESIIKQPKDKKILLKHILETKVNEKYYLSDKILNHFIYKHTYSKFKIKFNPTKGDKKAATLTASMGKMPITQDYVIDNIINENNNEILTGELGYKQPFIEREKSKTLLQRDYKGMNSYGINVVINKNYVQYDTNGTGNNSQGQRAYFEDGKSGALQRGGEKTGQVQPKVFNKKSFSIRRLTPLECMRLQTVNDDYKMPVSDTQKYKMLGNGWTIDVISYIFSYIK
jgi:DNA (cytosine-5)-methyltransferase 3A